MTKCRICGAAARREGESGDEIIYLKYSNGHTFQKKVDMSPMGSRIEKTLGETH